MFQVATPPGAMLPICVFTIEAVAIARTNCLLASLGPTNTLKVSFAVGEISALRSYRQARIKLSVDNEEMVRIVGTRDHDVQLLEILDLCNFDCHQDLINSFRLK
jgi:hypothetical protein